MASRPTVERSVFEFFARVRSVNQQAVRVNVGSFLHAVRDGAFGEQARTLAAESGLEDGRVDRVLGLPCDDPSAPIGPDLQQLAFFAAGLATARGAATVDTLDLLGALAHVGVGYDGGAAQAFGMDPVLLVDLIGRAGRSLPTPRHEPPCRFVAIRFDSSDRSAIEGAFSTVLNGYLPKVGELGDNQNGVIVMVASHGFDPIGAVAGFCRSPEAVHEIPMAELPDGFLSQR